MEKTDNKRDLLNNLEKMEFITEDELEQEESKLFVALKRRKKERRNQGRVNVGNVAGFDMAKFFKFKQQHPAKSIIDQISGGHLAWLLLVYTMFNNAMVIPWMIMIQADIFMRISWRHMLLNLILVPFVMYEKRKSPQEKAHFYEWKSVFQAESLKNAYLISISRSVWYVLVTQMFRYTAISHALVLGTLANFFGSLHRSLGRTAHFLEAGGQIFVVVGILIIVKDEIWLESEGISSDEYLLTSYLEKPWPFRLGGGLIALGSSLFMTVSGKYTTDIGKNYPSYMGMLIVNLMITVNMLMFGYFLHGATFDFDEKNGILSILASEHFVSFLSMSIFLGFGMFWSYAMIANLFPEPLLPSLAALFEPLISLMILDFMRVQQMSSGYTYMGIIFILPGMFLIQIGQYTYLKIKEAEEKTDEDRLKSIIDIKNERKISKNLDSSFSNFQAPSSQRFLINDNSQILQSPDSPAFRSKHKKRQLNQERGRESPQWKIVKEQLEVSDEDENYFGGLSFNIRQSSILREKQRNKEKNTENILEELSD